ncbi:MAG: hypothetical protein FWF23_03420 [Alphaproteobacteria bacterium]|nr:hypothetical protein [Alphaproteobacteria bacterium]MCL2505739.1 hypothetical protein [Alphaproteobacteria bacterium]
MRLKSFYAPTLSEAITEVKHVLGEDAIIVATHEDKNTNTVRVTAAIDESAVSTEKEKPPLPSSETGSDVIEVLAETLIRENVPFELSEQLLAIATQAVSDDARVCLSKAAESMGNFAAFDFDAPCMIVGTMGSGKTLCAAKMATQAVLVERTVTVISMDTERAGGNAQLETFTDILETEFIKIHDAQALKDLLIMNYSNMPYDSVFYIDTPSINIFDVSEKKYIKSLIETIKNSEQTVNVFLTIPAFMDVSLAREIIYEFQDIGAMGVIITGVDLLCHRGNLLKLAAISPLGCCLYSDTRKVTENLEILSSETAADFILRRDEKNGKHR